MFHIKHNREIRLDQSIKMLVLQIEKMSDSLCFKVFLSILSCVWRIPYSSLKIDLCGFIFSEYSLKHAKLSDRLRVLNVFSSIYRHVGFLLYILLRSKKYSIKGSYDIVLEGVESQAELNRYLKIINSFDKRLVVSVVGLKGEFHSLILKNFNSYDLQSILIQVLLDVTLLPLVSLLSFFCMTNLVVLYSRIVNRILYSESIFRHNHCKFLFQERHYGTSAIKNAIFKKYGGLVATTYQKNIIQLGSNGMFYSIDVMFSLGEASKNRVYLQGGDVKHFYSVGSLFLSNEKECIRRNEVSKYDVVLIGYNVGDFQDAYSNYYNDYYEHFEWLAKFSNKYSEYKIGIKHHINNTPDPRELDIIKNSNIVRLPHDFSSYEYCFNSKCSVTFGSTLAFELATCGEKIFFFDPGGRNVQYLPIDESIDTVRAKTYDDAERLLLQFLVEGKYPDNNIDWQKIIKNSHNVDIEIVKFFKSEKYKCLEKF